MYIYMYICVYVYMCTYIYHVRKRVWAHAGLGPQSWRTSLVGEKVDGVPSPSRRYRHVCVCVCVCVCLCVYLSVRPSVCLSPTLTHTHRGGRGVIRNLQETNCARALPQHAKRLHAQNVCMHRTSASAWVSFVIVMWLLSFLDWLNSFPWIVVWLWCDYLDSVIDYDFIASFPWLIVSWWPFSFPSASLAHGPAPRFCAPPGMFDCVCASVCGCVCVCVCAW